jgi:hypothetical protein
MTTTEEKLETLFARVRTLPKERQEMAVMLLEDIASADTEYVLSEEELAVLKPRLEDAQRGENLVDAKDVDILNKPWA